MLENILDPSALIGKDYLAHIVATNDGRTLTGIVRAEDKDAITLVTANETLTIPKADVEGRRPSEASMMHDDLLKPLSDVETRGLVAYLASPGQTPILATPENAPAFFNGRDLTGWEGDPKLWSVEGGEIVGKTAGLKRNEFLRSAMVAGDFRLTVDVKLVKNEGNSGIQFRSEPLPDGEMKGDQADVGAGWWGKLYEENGRGLLWKESGEAHVKLGDWNRYEVVASGSRVTTSINGQPCVDLDDPKGARRGIFAFQLHSGGPTEVRFRNIRLEIPAGVPTYIRAILADGRQFPPPARDTSGPGGEFSSRRGRHARRENRSPAPRPRPLVRPGNDCCDGFRLRLAGLPFVLFPSWEGAIAGAEHSGSAEVRSSALGDRIDRPRRPVPPEEPPLENRRLLPRGRGRFRPRPDRPRPRPRAGPGPGPRQPGRGPLRPRDARRGGGLPGGDGRVDGARVARPRREETPEWLERA